MARSKEWAVRCMHEASLHQNNAFITLTYNDQHIPTDGGLRKEDFQKFMKRLRSRIYYELPGHKIKYYMCGEYGTSPDGGLGRPHFHAIIFGFDFGDKKLWEEKGKNRYYRSSLLESLWTYGYSNITDVNYRTAAYVARYVMKKITGDLAESHYQKVDPETGELYRVAPEYNSMSLNPAIAYEWYQRFSADVFPHDYVIVDGRKVKTPSYYLKQLEKQNPEQFDRVKKRRKEYAIQNRQDDATLQRREICARSNLNRTRRPLE